MKERSNIETLISELSTLNDQLEEESNRLDRLEKVVQIITRVKETIEYNKEEVTIVSICQLFKTLHEHFTDEFNIFGLINLLPHLLTCTVDMASFSQTISGTNNEEQKEWDPLENPRYLVHLFDSWSPLTAYFTRERQSVLASHTTSMFQSSIEAICLPKIRRALVSWNPYDPDNCVCLMDSLRLVVPPIVFTQTIDMIVLPRLASAVSSWKPSSDPLPHLWLHPWLKLLTSKLSALYPELRRKMAQALSNWHPITSEMELSEPRRLQAEAMMRPWVEVFDPTSFENTIVRSVIPKLVTLLRDHLVVNPQEQQIIPFQSYIQWYGVVPHLHMACLLAGEVLPKWIKVLYRWLTSESPDFGEISIWYSGWKSLIENTTLESDPVVMSFFNLALEMMQTCLMNDNDNINPLHPFDNTIKEMEKLNYVKHLENKKLEFRSEQQQQQARNTTNATNSTKGSFNSSISFKEVVEIFAERNNIEFVLKVGKYYEGKQVYQFGNCICYIDHNIVYASNGKKRSLNNDGSDGKWSPIDLEELLLLAK